MKKHPYTIAEPWDYELSTGRHLYANGGFIGLAELASGFAISQGYDGGIDFGETYADDPAFAAEIWTLAERQEFAEFMIAQWTAYRQSLTSASEES